MTLEEKKRFFALHWGQKVLIDETWSDYETQLVDERVFQYDYIAHKTNYLELTSLEDITDEDAIHLFNIVISPKPHQNMWGMERFPKTIQLILHSTNKRKANERFIIYTNDLPRFYWNGHSAMNQIVGYDYLRSKGYALPWMEYSVEDLIKEGVIKLKGR